uniref:Fibronectin type-III domain-containing protein n=1 Tax=Ascaris lumbricoides TaxID=6252 RepID=A0A0M3IJA0_ASCLU
MEFNKPAISKKSQALSSSLFVHKRKYFILFQCYLECMKERMHIQEICGNEERYPVRWLKIPHVLYTGNYTYAVDVEVILASSISITKHSLALEYRSSKTDWRTFAVNAVSNGHRFRILGLKKGFEYQFRVWYVWDEEVLCGMPFVSKWIEPEGALLASVNASSFFKDIRFSVSTSGHLRSAWNIANPATFTTIGDHLLYYELSCRGISGYHSNDCGFNQIHFYLNNETDSTSFMLPPIGGPCLYQVQLSAIFRNCPTKTFSKTIQYAPLSVGD